MTTILDGKNLSTSLLVQLKDEIKGFKRAPNLAIIIVGNDPASEVYVKNKCKTANLIGIEANIYKFPCDITEENLINSIDSVAKNDQIDAMIVQLPLPDHINKLSILNAIPVNKDVDGFHSNNVGNLHLANKFGFIPCTPLGCIRLIKYYENNLSGLHAVIIGRSDIVGKPMSALLLQENCTVTICHSKTINLINHTKSADIVISAIGKPGFLTYEYFNQNAMVIDVGINRISFNDKVKLVGDVDFDNVFGKVKYLTPVPGGVGPMTVISLMINVIRAYKIANELTPLI